jgi:hypothetical protein
MKITAVKNIFFRETFIPKLKNMFNFGRICLERSPKSDVVEVNKFLNTPGIKSDTFRKLLSPEFTLKDNRDISGAKLTTIIDKKTQKPVQAYVAMAQEDKPGCEHYLLMVKDKKGKVELNKEKFKVVGETIFYVNKNEQMITPGFELVFVDGVAHERMHSYMRAEGNKDYSGIGVRLHQLRIERMFQNNLGNVRIAADGNSFPFHYAMGYRLRPNKRPVGEAKNLLEELSKLNKKQPRENAQYLSIDTVKDRQVLNVSASIENCINDYYKNGGEPIKEFMPNMFLDRFSLEQWLEIVEKQPILY